MARVIEIEEKLATDHKNILQEVIWIKEMKRGLGKKYILRLETKY